MLNGENRRQNCSEIHNDNLWLDMGSDWAVMDDSFISQHTKFSTLNRYCCIIRKKKNLTVATNLKNFMLTTVDKNKKGSQLWTENLSLSQQLSIKCFPCGSDGKASAYNLGDPGWIPGSGSSPGEGNGNPLQYSCLENPMDGGVR